MQTKFAKFIVTLLVMAAIVLGGLSYYLYELNKKSNAETTELIMKIERLKKEKELVTKQLEEKIASISKEK